MATGGDANDDPSARQLLHVAKSMTEENVEIFAEVYLEIKPARLDALKHDNPLKSDIYKLRILEEWKERGYDNDAQLLADLLYKAIDEHGVADPQRVEEILCIPRPKTKTFTRPQPNIDEKEFLDLAEKLRPHTARSMKIEVAPWMEEYVVDMDDLYCELTLEKINKKPFDENCEPLENYENLFDDSSLKVVEKDQTSSEGAENENRATCVRSKVKTENKKILVKADPGMAKWPSLQELLLKWCGLKPQDV